MTNRHALSLSAVLAATVLTGGAAILGLNHSSTSPAPAAAPAPAAVVQAQPAQAPTWEEGD
jgi:hypothetical protein